MNEKQSLLKTGKQSKEEKTILGLKIKKHQVMK
jgi:hypothetical protein